MLHRRITQVFLFAVALVAIASSTFLSSRLWRESGLRALETIAEQRVQLVANAVSAEVSRQDHLPVVLALDPDVRHALADRSNSTQLQELSRKLERLSREADTRALYVIGLDGTVLASDDWSARDTLLGRNVGERPYFKEAVEHGKSSYLGLEPDSDRVRYYLAYAVRDPDVRGVAVVRIEFDALENAWERTAERVLVTDQNGIVFLASDPAYKYRSMGPIAPASGHPQAFQPYPGFSKGPLSSAVLERRGAASIVRLGLDDASSYLYLSMPLTQYGWTIHRLADLSLVHEDARDGAIIGGALSALIISLLLYIMQRHRAYVSERSASERLKREVAERTRELRETNRFLETEVEEHRATEAQLRTAQNELVQAGKLAALGQMSAAIAHEINQPLAAIRTFLASTRIFAERGELAQVAKNLGLVNDLAERMASITSHLKMFARKSELGRSEPVLVEQAVHGALFLLESQIARRGIRVDKDVQSGLWVKGNAVQLEQVLVNLLSNAVDAVSGVADPSVDIRVTAAKSAVCITVADNGPGIPARELDRIFDPFFTTKAVGKGLGLGLSISYGIVQEFGGQIHASNRQEGGAELSVELPLYVQNAGATREPVHA